MYLVLLESLPSVKSPYSYMREVMLYWVFCALIGHFEIMLAPFNPQSATLLFSFHPNLYTYPDAVSHSIIHAYFLLTSTGQPLHPRRQGGALYNIHPLHHPPTSTEQDHLTIPICKTLSFTHPLLLSQLPPLPLRPPHQPRNKHPHPQTRSSKNPSTESPSTHP